MSLAKEEREVMNIKKVAIAEQFNYLRTSEDRKQFTNHIKYALTLVDVDSSDNYMVNIKNLQKFINISNYCFKLDNMVFEENMDKSDEIFNLGTNI